MTRFTRSCCLAACCLLAQGTIAEPRPAGPQRGTVTQKPIILLRKDTLPKTTPTDAITANNTGARMFKLNETFTEDTWNGFKRLNFKVYGANAWIVVPPVPAEGNPWSWCMEFPDAFTKRCAAIELIQNGYYHVHVVVGNTYGCPAAQEIFAKFYDILQQSGLAPKGVLIGISRGGLYAYRFAALHPQAVSVIYGDAPVCDFKSWPGGKGKGVGSPNDWKNLITYYNFKDEQEAMESKLNPIDLLPVIAEHDIKIVHVVGDIDNVVPFEENTKILQERFEKLGGTIQVYHKRDCGHHPHGLEDDSPVVDFILKNNR